MKRIYCSDCRHYADYDCGIGSCAALPFIKPKRTGLSWHHAPEPRMAACDVRNRNNRCRLFMPADREHPNYLMLVKRRRDSAGIGIFGRIRKWWKWFMGDSFADYEDSVERAHQELMKKS